MTEQKTEIRKSSPGLGFMASVPKIIYEEIFQKTLPIQQAIGSFSFISVE